MCLDPDSDVMPSLIAVSSYHLFWLQYITGCYQIMLSIPHYWSWFFELGLKQCSCFVWFGPRSLSHMTARDELGVGRKALGLPQALFAECAGIAAKLRLLFCGSLPKPALCCVQPTCGRRQGWECTAPCMAASPLGLRQETRQQVRVPKIWVREKQPGQAGCQLTDLPRRTNRSK